MPKKINLIAGQKYGEWIVLAWSHHKNGHSFYLCKCSCGIEKTTASFFLRNGQSQSCGCIPLSLHRKKMASIRKPHARKLKGLRHTLIQRCYDKKQPCYPNYGGRGIEVCEEWLSSLEEFRSWALSHGYDPSLTIDRINVNGNYEPSNCRFVTRYIQNRNKRNNRFVEVNGERMILEDAKKITGMTRKALLGLNKLDPTTKS